MMPRAWLLFLMCGCSGAYAYGMLHGAPARVLRVPAPVMKKGRAVGGGPAIGNGRKKRNKPVALNPGAPATTEPECRRDRALTYSPRRLARSRSDQASAGDGEEAEGQTRAAGRVGEAAGGAIPRTRRCIRRRGPIAGLR